MLNTFWNYLLLQLLFLIVVIYAGSFLISLLNRLFYSLLSGRRAVCLATGVIGTPIHELSHALMCLIFGHKIEQIRLFQIDDQNGVLGYVRHSYNRRNFWHILGNYFIGVAPILASTVLLYFLAQHLLPDTFAQMKREIQKLIALQQGTLTSDYFWAAMTMLENVLICFLEELTAGYKAWVFLMFFLCIALHMNLSGADIKGSLGALPIVIVLLAAINALFCFLISAVYGDFIYVIMGICGYITWLLVLSVGLCLVYIFAALAVKGGISLVKAIPKRKSLI